MGFLKSIVAQPSFVQSSVRKNALNCLNLFARIAAILSICFVGGAAFAFDPKPWLADLRISQEAFEQKYANIEWAVNVREANLPELFAQARDQIQHARSDAEAKSAFERLGNRLGDGHVAFEWPVTSKSLAQGAKQTTCSNLGYDERQAGRSLISAAPEYQSLETQQSKIFPAGLLTIGNKKVGIIRIGLFSPKAYPQLCQAAWTALNYADNQKCDEVCSQRIEEWASNRMTVDFIEQIHAIEAAEAQLLLVDVTGNGGGSEWAEAAARIVTPIRLKSERVGFVRSQDWVDKFRRDETLLREASEHANEADKIFLAELVDGLVKRRKSALIHCSSAPLWHGQSLSCTWLGEGIFATGLLDSADPTLLRGKAWAGTVFSPMEYPFEEGIWRGPLAVLVDQNSWSAAEEFAAVLQDNKAAVIIGAPTGGAGCGHATEGDPVKLSHTGGIVKLPDCARFRVDGTNEVAGIQPDILVGFRRSDGIKRRAALAVAKLKAAIESGGI